MWITWEGPAAAGGVGVEGGAVLAESCGMVASEFYRMRAAAGALRGHRLQLRLFIKSIK
jgi:hypothetical protein